MRPFTPNTVTEPGQIEYELAALHPGDLVMEHGQYRDEVCCAGVAVRGHDGWWALGSAARGLSMPTPLLDELQVAAAALGYAPR
jgi:DNA-binding IclR family transcriptional regulator